MKISKNQISLVYLSFAVVGAVFPSLANFDFIQAYGAAFDVQKFIELANANPASVSLSRDLFISASAIFVWILIESRRLEMKNLWIVFLGTFIIAFAFSAPFFLYLRERRIIELEEQGITVY